MDMSNHLSIRTYSRQRQGHAHRHHQLVLPIRGAISIELQGFTGKVAVGECVIIRAGQLHHFRADESARFIVADLETLPASLLAAERPLLPITPPLLSYLLFVEKQLEYQVDSSLEASVCQVFCQLLEKQGRASCLDPRIRTAQIFIGEHLCARLEIATLAAIACLSPTQFKKRFREQLGCSVHQYVIRQRMEKARALLTHTDLPVQLIAEQVGYGDLSAFSRRFSRHFGLSPRHFCR